MEAGSIELRTTLHGMWASVADGWAEHADFIDERATPLSERLLSLAALRPGERVLELACGPGGLGLAAAPLVEPGGEVVLSDVAAEMVAIAARRAEAKGLGNVTTRTLDLEEIDEPDESFDVALCREGLMLTPDPVRAGREIRRVLRPGGRVALSVWGPRSRNPWLGGLMDAVSAQIGAPVPPPGIPGPFALEDAGQLEHVLVDAGLEGVSVAELPLPMRVGSVEEWWGRTSALAGPLAKMLAAMPAEAADGIRAHAAEAAEPYRTGDGIEFPGVVLVASARR